MTALATLPHTHVVSMLGYFLPDECNGSLVVVYPYLGASLWQIFGCIHELGIIHDDVAMENMMMEGGTVKVANQPSSSLKQISSCKPALSHDHEQVLQQPWAAGHVNMAQNFLTVASRQF